MTDLSPERVAETTKVGRIGFADPAAHEPSPSTRSRPDGGHPLRGALDGLCFAFLGAVLGIAWVMP